MKLLNKLKFILLALIFTILILTVKTYATTGTITEVSVNLREKPSTDSKKIMYVTQDDKVEILEKSGEWYKIKYKDTTGYVFGEYVKVDENNIVTVDDKKDVQQKEVVKEEQEITKDVKAKLKINSNTKIRIVPNISSNVIYTSKSAQSIEIIEQINNWTYIYVNKIYGWVRTDKIIEENIVDTKADSSNEIKDQKQEKEQVKKKEETKTAYVKYDTVNLREKASATSKSLAKLKLNDEVTVIEKADSVWSKVKVDGITGYISTDLLSDKKQEKAKEDENTTSRSGNETAREESKTSEEKKTTTDTLKETVSKTEDKITTSSKSTTGDEIVAYAKKYLGYKYVYGGTSPKTGFDCSGFTYYVYKHFGYTLSRSSTAQAKNGKEVSKRDLQPGDLVIYKNASLTRIGHVGIYIGNNKMIHASEPGVGVVVTDIDSKAHNYPKRYVTARRIIK